MKISLKPLWVKSEKETDKCTVLGPWLGEFGPELIYWQGYVRNYCRSSPDYVIAISREENSCLYKEVDEFWAISVDRELEPDFYLAGKGLSRRQVYKSMRSLLDHSPYDFLALPDRIHQKGILEFGAPRKNQSFEILESDFTSFLKMEVKGPYVLLFPRVRKVAPEKNWLLSSWGSLARRLQELGFRVVWGGGFDSRFDLEGIHPWRWNIAKRDWLNLQIGLVKGSAAVISGESGPGFLPGLCKKPGVIFGADRERQRYLVRENIFSAPIEYISSRDPRPEEVIEAFMRIKE